MAEKEKSVWEVLDQATETLRKVEEQMRETAERHIRAAAILRESNRKLQDANNALAESCARMKEANAKVILILEAFTAAKEDMSDSAGVVAPVDPDKLYN